MVDKTVLRAYNIIIGVSFILFLLSATQIIFNVCNMAIEIPISIGLFTAIGLVSFAIDKHNYIKEIEGILNNENKVHTSYRNLDEIFYDFYNNKRGVEHRDGYDTHFKEGDVVTTDCGFDLGIVASDCSDGEPVVYARYTKLQSDRLADIPNKYGDSPNWYKTGINVDMYDWKNMCRRYW